MTFWEVFTIVSLMCGLVIVSLAGIALAVAWDAYVDRTSVRPTVRRGDCYGKKRN